MIKGKQLEVPKVLMTPYTASIVRSLLKHLQIMGTREEIDREAKVHSLTSEQIKQYLLRSDKTKIQCIIPHDTAR